MSVRELAEECARIAPGTTITQGALTNIERGPDSTAKRGRRDVTVEELFTIAAALRVAPILIILPVGDQGLIEIMPGHVTHASDTLDWVNGKELPLSLPLESTKAEVDAYRSEFLRNSLPLRLVAEYDAACERARQLFADFSRIQATLEVPTSAGFSAATKIRSIALGLADVLANKDLSLLESRSLLADARDAAADGRANIARLYAAVERVRVAHAVLGSAVKDFMDSAVVKGIPKVRVPQDLHEAMDMFYKEAGKPDTEPMAAYQAKMVDAEAALDALGASQDAVDRLSHELSTRLLDEVGRL